MNDRVLLSIFGRPGVRLDRLRSVCDAGCVTECHTDLLVNLGYQSAEATD